jgi:hypothetical protein
LLRRVEHRGDLRRCVLDLGAEFGVLRVIVVDEPVGRVAVADTVVAITPRSGAVGDRIAFVALFSDPKLNLLRASNAKSASPTTWAPWEYPPTT